MGGGGGGSWIEKGIKKKRARFAPHNPCHSKEADAQVYFSSRGRGTKRRAGIPVAAEAKMASCLLR